MPILVFLACSPITGLNINEMTAPTKTTNETAVMSGNATSTHIALERENRDHRLEPDHLQAVGCVAGPAGVQPGSVPPNSPLRVPVALSHSSARLRYKRKRKNANN